jgi:hypothetical protein
MKRLALPLLLLTALASACHQEVSELTCPTPKDLTSAPERWEGVSTCVAGLISERWDVPLTGNDYFKVLGDDGAIWVKGSSPPPSGARLVVYGRLTRAQECGFPLPGLVFCEDARRLAR